MSREISLFNPYSEGENRQTNYCGLVLKMIYEASAEAFEDIINMLVEEDSTFVTSPRFSQQTKQKNNVPDLSISQPSFHISFETKVSDWFYNDQIKRHLDGIFEKNKHADYKILFLLTSEYQSDIDERLQESIEIAKAAGITLQCITFEQLIGAITSAAEKHLNPDNYLRTIVPQFEEYLSGEGLLEEWKHRLDIVPCKKTKTEVLQLGIYVCPAIRRSYSHQRSKYFGAYWDKNVNYLAEIMGVVTVQADETGDLVYNKKHRNDNSISDERLVAVAKERFSRCEGWRFQEVKNKELQIFVLENGTALDYQKRTKGGLRAKTYHYVKAESVETLFEELNGKTWD